MGTKAKDQESTQRTPNEKASEIATPRKNADLVRGGGGGGFSTFDNLGDDYDGRVLASSQHWAVIWGRAIAMAWGCPKFKKKLLDPNTTRDAFESDLNYKLNAGLELVIEEDKKAAYKGGTADPWSSLKKHKLIMYLPPQPPLAQQAIAIAEYADTGRSYPFTSL